MTVNTKKVAGRRKLRYQSLKDMLEDAERLASAERVQQLGNWSLGQALSHLASAMTMSIDGTDYQPNPLLRLLGPLFKRRLLNGPMPAGFKLPKPLHKDLLADICITTEEGLQQLRAAVQRLEEESIREPHAVLGKLTREEWNQLHLRHAELHLSFFVK